MYKDVAELKHTVYKRVQLKKSGPSISSLQSVQQIQKQMFQRQKVNLQ